MALERYDAHLTFLEGMAMASYLRSSLRKGCYEVDEEASNELTGGLLPAEYLQEPFNNRLVEHKSAAERARLC